MESTGMIKMATGEGLPPPEGCRNGSRLAFGGYGGFWRRNSRSNLCSGSFRIRGYIWVKGVRRWTEGVATRQGARLPPPRRALHPRGPLVAPLTDFFAYIYPYTLKPLGNRIDREFRHRKPL